MNLKLQQLLGRVYREKATEVSGDGNGMSAPVITGADVDADAAGTDTSGDSADSKAATGDTDAKGGTENKPAGDEKPAGPSDSEAKLLKEVMDKKAALKRAQQESQELKDKLAQFDGVDLDAVKKLLDQQKDEETKKLEAKGEWDRLRQQMLAEHTKDVEKKQAEAEAARKEAATLRATIAELTIGSAFTSSEFIRDDLTLTPAKTRVIYGNHFDFSEGKVVAFDKPTGAAERTMLVDGQGEPLSFESALKKIIEADPEKDQLIRAKAKPGAGSRTTTPKGEAPSKTQDMSSRDKIAAGLKDLNIFDKSGK